jgi:tripartite-type tricarboxylate transporter receptor subunit TctC
MIAAKPVVDGLHASCMTSFPHGEHMPSLRTGLSAFCFGLTLVCTAPLSAQPYPNKPVRILTSDPGGGSDFSARLVAQGMSPTLGQQVIVDNRAGGGIAGETVSKAPPDGYTLLYYASSLWLLPLMRMDVPYDMKDFAPISWTVKTPAVLVVHPSLPVKSVKELVALAKARPGELNYASGAAGSSNHLAAELFKSMAAVNITRIPYRGYGAAVNDLLGGQVQLMFPTSNSVMQHINAGRLRALAVTSAQPSATLPGLSTISETGLPGYEAIAVTGMLAPAKTPEAIIGRLNQEVVRALNRSDIKEKLLKVGTEPVGSSPQDFAAKIRSEVASMGKVIRDVGIRDE